MLKYRSHSDPLPNADDLSIKIRIAENFGIFVVFMVAAVISLLAFLSEVMYYSKPIIWAKKNNAIKLLTQKVMPFVKNRHKVLASNVKLFLCMLLYSIIE